MVSGARALAERDVVRRTLVALAALTLGILLAGWLGHEGPAAARAQSLEQQGDTTQSPPDRPS
jgi:hypothetical protein